jgi:hypothetical protein
VVGCTFLTPKVNGKKVEPMADDEFASLAPTVNPLAQALKQELSEMILWNEHNSPRSKQLALGPSEIGDPCDRRLAYRLAGIPPVNIWADPWPAIVGTSIHSWLERAINTYQEVNGDRGWLTELKVSPDYLVRGSSDVFNVRTSTVVDHKTCGAKTMQKLHKGQPPQPGYITQVQLYGLGHKRAGRNVENVALIFYPRSGWLDDAFVWVAPYDEKIAVAALERMYKIAEQLIDFDIEQNPHRFQLIDATPGDSCVWCDHFCKEKDPDVAADERGCPGR